MAKKDYEESINPRLVTVLWIFTILLIIETIFLLFILLRKDAFFLFNSLSPHSISFYPYTMVIIMIIICAGFIYVANKIALSKRYKLLKSINGYFLLACTLTLIVLAIGVYLYNSLYAPESFKYNYQISKLENHQTQEKKKFHQHQYLLLLQLPLCRIS